MAAGACIILIRPDDQPDVPPRESISRFHSASVPQISILEYLRRIVRFTNLEVCPGPFSPSLSTHHPISFLPLILPHKHTTKLTRRNLIFYISLFIFVPFPTLISPRFTTTMTDESIQTEDLSAPRFALHRPDLRARANLHDILPDRSPIHHLRRLPLLKIALRCLLHKRALCSRRRPRPIRALSSRARLSSGYRLAPRMHPRGPPTILRQPRRPFRRQVFHSLG